jgi:hypothetical protein
MHANILDLKQNLATGRDASIIEVFQHFVLRVDSDSFSASEILEINAATAASKAQLDSIVNQAFAFQALAKAHFHEQIDCSLLQHAGAHALLGILATPILHDDGVNPLQIQKVRQHQTGGTSANDSDLGTL